MTAYFNPERLRDQRVGVLSDFSPENKTLLITFSGIGQGVGVPIFEFFRSLNGFSINKLFVRDPKRLWYHDGIPGFSRDIEETAAGLRDLIEESGATRVITFGNSMGAYAAILFGGLLEVDEVHAFAPVTFTDWRNRIRHLDYRFNSYFRKLDHPTNTRKNYTDLRMVPNIDVPSVHLYYDIDTRLERVHAHRMADVHSNVYLHPYYGGGHNVIKLIKGKGDLDRIMARAIGLERKPLLSSVV